MSEAESGARPFRWIAAIVVLGVVSAALGVLAWEALDASIDFIGDGTSRDDDAIVLSTEDGAPSTGTAGDDGSVTVDLSQTEGETEPGPSATYEVQPGDTGSTIASQLFGRQDAWSQIAEFNDLAPSDTLEVGQVLRIPEL